MTEPGAPRLQYLPVDVSLKEYVEAVLDEQRRGMIVAEQEREKAAAALRETLERQINEGDRHLKEHIAQQVAQIRDALQAEERLGMARLESLRRETALIAEASGTAIAKAEIATEKRFESVNEFRAQLADVIATFLPREVADAQLAELRESIARLTRRMDVSAGGEESIAEHRKQTRNLQALGIALGTLIIGAIATAVTVIALVN